MRGTVPLVVTPSCVQYICSLHIAILSVFPFPPIPEFPFDPLLDSLVACQRLTVLELAWGTLSLQSLLKVLNGLHNLRTLGLDEVSLSDEENESVSDWVLAAWTVNNRLQCLEYSIIIQFNCLSFQALTDSNVHVIASSVDHHPSLRELTVRRCSESLVKGAVEGMAKRHDVKKLVVAPYNRG